MKVLELYNKIWEVRQIPSGWKESLIVPIIKSGKDASNLINYRPILLTSHLGKIIETLVSGKLMHLVVEKGLIVNYQNGFRKGRSMNDSIICLEAK